MVITPERKTAMEICQRLGLGHVAVTYITGALEDAVRFEREACAKVAENYAPKMIGDQFVGYRDESPDNVVESIAAAIRARSDEPTEEPQPQPGA